MNNGNGPNRHLSVTQHLGGVWMVIRLFVIVLILIGLSVPSYSATWFVGTGNDGYLNDVEGIYAALSQSYGVQGITNSFIYEDQSGTAIENQIYGLKNSIQKGDLIFWYYSGHGSYADDDNQDETSQNSNALNEYDEVIGLSNQSDLVTDDDLATAFKTLSSIGATIITLFDTCYAGGFIGGSNDLNSVPDLIFFGSSTERQESYAYTNQPYSIFTQGLISGLENFNADLDNDGIILASEWFDFSYGYTTSNVSMQHPVFWGDGYAVITSMNSVPSPESFLLLASGLLGLTGVSRKKK